MQDHHYAPESLEKLLFQTVDVLGWEQEGTYPLKSYFFFMETEGLVAHIHANARKLC